MASAHQIAGIGKRGWIVIQVLEEEPQEEGIVDVANADGSLGPEEMRRFFRAVLKYENDCDPGVFATPTRLHAHPKTAS